MRKQKKTIKLSLCMIVRDEEASLPRCLKSVEGVADEIIVVDTGSKDRTMNLAKEFGAKVIQTRWSGDYSKARNISLKEARGDWILVLDADETIASQDIPKLKFLLGRYGITGFRFTMRDYCDDYNLLRNWQICIGEYKHEEGLSGCRGWVPFPKVNLFRNRKDVFYGGCTEHAIVDDSINRIKGKIEDADIVIHHFQCLKGKKYIINKQLGALGRCIKQSLKKYPDSPAVHYNIAIGLFSFKKDDSGAIRHLKRAIMLSPALYEAYNLLGMAYLEIGRYSMAVDILNRSLAINQESSDTHCLLGIAHEKQGRSKAAFQSLKKALRLKHFHPVAHNSLGVCYAREGSFKKASDEFNKTLEILPSYKEAHCNLEAIKQCLGAK